MLKILISQFFLETTLFTAWDLVLFNELAKGVPGGSEGEII